MYMSTVKYASVFPQPVCVYDKSRGEYQYYDLVNVCSYNNRYRIKLYDQYRETIHTMVILEDLTTFFEDYPHILDYELVDDKYHTIPVI
jgi:hypothetical protein